MTATPETVATRGGVDRERIQTLYRELLIAVGEDPDREGLRDTPSRAAAWWSEFLDHAPGRVDTVFTQQTEGASTHVAVRGITAWTLCEHHLLPFHVQVAIAYLPTGQVLGLSKLIRIVQDHAHRLQLQERLTRHIADDVAAYSGSCDVGVWAEGEHLCMSMRGVRAEQARTTTAALLGRAHSDPSIAARLRSAVASSGVPQ